MTHGGLDVNAKKIKSKSSRQSAHGKARKRLTLAQQVEQLRRELREVKGQRDCFAREISRWPFQKSLSSSFSVGADRAGAGTGTGQIAGDACQTKPDRSV